MPRVSSGGHVLYLVRHAIAAERGPGYPDDEKRPLTRAGVRRFREAVRGLQAVGVELDLILTSPLARAVETARLLHAGFGDAQMTVWDALEPAVASKQTLTSLREHRRHARIALVGHEPALGALAAELLRTPIPVPFKKGGVCCLGVSALPPLEPATLVWMATPRILRCAGAVSPRR
ncbi:MAG: phosphohistidine phosphatase SixA [Vicinamibacterales bacterium]